VDDAHFEIDWRTVVVHFGANKDVEVGQLSVHQLSWYASDWQKRGAHSHTSQADSELLAAVRIALKSVQEGTHAPDAQTLSFPK
jgi:hypothetical protein